MFETTKSFSIPEQAAVPQQEVNTITEKAGSDSDSDYDEGDSDFEFAAQ